MPKLSPLYQLSMVRLRRYGQSEVQAFIMEHDGPQTPRFLKFPIAQVSVARVKFKEVYDGPYITNAISLCS